MNLNFITALWFVLFGGTLMTGAAEAPSADTDYDGRTDEQELADGTDPRDPRSVERVRLGYWRFDGTNWAGERGQLPLYATSVQHVPGFDGTALQVSNGNARVRYREVETNGLANFNCRNGSIRFWFKPDWTSKNIGGTGPRTLVRLIALGQWAVPGKNTNANDGAFLFSLSPDGNGIGLSLQDNQGHSEEQGSQPVSFRAGVWHEIALTLQPHQVEVWLDGTSRLQWGTTNTFPYPPARVRARGFTVGNAPDGGMSAHGEIDELETFNYALGAAGMKRNGQALAARVWSAPPRVDLEWRCRPQPGLAVQRREPEDTNWATLSTNVFGWTFSDTNVSAGRKYEYKILPHGVSDSRTNLSMQTGLDLPPQEQRGKVILLVDDTLAGTLAAELARLKSDLTGDGWIILRHDVPRHDDAVWARNTNNIARIKAQIVADYTADPAHTQTILVVGHVAVPYSGMSAEDGHTTPQFGVHLGAWATDLYYGDVDGRWTDQLPYASAAPPMFAETRNDAGDGKFDQNALPANGSGVARLELSVGRVDFAKMPAYAAAQPSRSETDLLRYYLNKDHAYRHKLLVFAPRILAHNYLPSGFDDVILSLPAGLGSRFFGLDPDRVVDGDLFVEKRPHLWGFQGGYGGPERINNDQPYMHTTRDLTTSAVPVAFCVLSGSWFADWNLGPDNLMRATLCASNYGLAAMWGLGSPRWRFEGMALGDTLGDGQRLSANAPGATIRTLNLLGDPTLRLNVPAPPANATAVSGGGNVTLNWSASSESNARYFVYRSRGGMDGAFVRLSGAPVNATSFTDTNAPAGQKVYQVRALNLTVTGSGSYTNLSQAIFVTVN